VYTNYEKAAAATPLALFVFLVAAAHIAIFVVLILLIFFASFAILYALSRVALHMAGIRSGFANPWPG
jgi:hypothetical protein